MTDGETDIPEAAHGLAQIGLYLRASQWREADRLGLTPTQVGTLTLIKRRGPARVQALAAHLNVRHATMSDAVAALARKGLVTKQPDPHDRRAVLIAPTPDGRRVAAEQDRVPAALAAALNRLDPADRGALKRALARVIRELQQQGAIAPQRMCVTCRHFRPNMHDSAATPHHCAFVDAAFGDANLLFDCGDHEAAAPTEAVERP
jgi:DNA-binding MarR family transcriptional regulator